MPFLAGYGAAQAVPGPLFTFAAYLGAVMGPEPNGWIGATLCLVGGVPAVVPAGHRRAAVLGGPARNARARKPRCAASTRRWSGCCWPRFTIRSGPPASPGPADFALAVAAFLLLFMWQTPPWLVVVLCAAGGSLLKALPLLP